MKRRLIKQHLQNLQERGKDATFKKKTFQSVTIEIAELYFLATNIFYEYCLTYT